MPRRRSSTGSLRLTPDDGVTGPIERKVIECRRQRAPSEVALALDLKAGDAAVQIRRLLYFRSPGGPGRHLAARHLVQGAHGRAAHRLPGADVRAVRAGVRRAHDPRRGKLRAVGADAPAAELLQVAPGYPLLSVERLSYTYGDKPVEFRRGLYNTASHFYRNELQ